MSRARLLLAVVGGCVLSWLLGTVVVVVMLRWSDSMPYAGAVTERRYAIVAATAMTIWWGGSGLSIMFGRRVWRAKKHPVS